MSEWPYDGPPDPGDDETVVIGRMANLIIPVSTSVDHVASIHMVMPERDARAIMNMDPGLAHEYGPFFEVLKDSITAFLQHEG